MLHKCSGENHTDKQRKQVNIMPLTFRKSLHPQLMRRKNPLVRANHHNHAYVNGEFSLRLTALDFSEQTSYLNTKDSRGSATNYFPGETAIYKHGSWLCNESGRILLNCSLNSFTTSKRHQRCSYGGFLYTENTHICTLHWRAHFKLNPFAHVILFMLNKSVNNLPALPQILA